MAEPYPCYPRHGEQAVVCWRLRKNRRLPRAKGTARVAEG